MARFTLPRDLYHGKGSLEMLKTLGGTKAEKSIIDEQEFLAKLPEIAANAIGDACTGSNPPSAQPGRNGKTPSCLLLRQRNRFLRLIKKATARAVVFLVKITVDFA